MAAKMKKNATVKDKFGSGFKDIDVVTSADLTTQEFVLKALVKNEVLANCEVVAEEDTPSKKTFAKKSDFVITLDPIDGTLNYSNGGKYYSIIVTVHDKKRPLYTFDYFPELDWGIKIVNDEFEFIGEKPDFSHIKIAPKTIVYPFLDGLVRPDRSLGKKYDDLVKRGYSFRTKAELGYGIGATLSFLMNLVDGFYYENGSAVDCLVGLHFGLANKFETLQNIDIREPKKRDYAEGSEEYRGYYLVLKNNEKL